MEKKKKYTYSTSGNGRKYFSFRNIPFQKTFIFSMQAPFNNFLIQFLSFFYSLFIHFIFVTQFLNASENEFIYIYLIKYMQADYQLMPKRNGKSDGSFKNAKSVKFFTNYYEITTDPDKSKIYQYSFALPENIPQDSALYKRAIPSIRKLLKEKIGYLAHSGQMIWGTLPLKVPTTLQCNFEFDETKHQLEAVIKITKEMNLKDLDDEKTRATYIQILNVNLKNMLASVNLTQLGKQSQYFQKEFDGSKQLDEKGLSVLKGFRFTLSPLNSGLLLQVDVCSRVLQSKNLLQTFNGKSKDEIIEEYTGSTVISKYGTYRTYKIDEIDFSKSPLSKFHNERKGVDMTYIDYYKEAYGIVVRNTKQPLLHAVKNIKKELQKGGKKLIEVKEFVYLVPELVSLTGMTDDQRADHQTMKALAPFTKLSPTERVRQCAAIIERLNGVNGLIKIKNPKRMDGYCLQRPDLIYSGAKIQPDNRGNIKHRGVLKEPFNFTDWLFVYSLSKNSKKDDQQADDAVDLLIKSAQSYGVKFKNPGFITTGGNLNEWKNKIKQDIEKNGAPQIIVIFLTNFEQKYYGELKRYITNQLKVPSQFIRKRTLNNPKGAMSAASKIIIQMNIKVGSVPWEVQKRHPFFKNRNIMYGALSISKGSKGYTQAFVGTINAECTKVFSDCKVGIKDKQNVPVQLLEEMFVNWAKSYFQTNNKKVPDLIILYRQGLSVAQTKSQLPRMEIPALHNMIKQIGIKTKTNNYNPQIVIVTVNKKVNSKYFNVGKQNQQNPNKFVPQLTNVDSGSIIIEPMSSQDSYDFHLAAQYVTQGTCTPTLFKVAYDTSKMPQEALINFTFEQCFNYYNWEGAVRVPACLQCADKLSKLVSQYVKETIIQSAVTKKHFFL